MKSATRYALLILALLCESLSGSFAQTQSQMMDTACSPSSTRKRYMHNIFQQAWNSIQRSEDDYCANDPEQEVLNARAEDLFKFFAGKVIRHIYVNNLGFDRSFTDTSSHVNLKNIGTRLARALHTDTREWVVRNNLFIKEKTRLDPFILADNERYLRTLDYLQDARIIVRADPKTKDSVDVFIITKDVFSIKLVLDNNGLSTVKARLSESNFLGMGQKVQATVLADKNRDPMLGYGFEYSKNNIGGSFAHLTLSYNNIDIGRSYGFENEVSTLFLLERPLPSVYDHFAGALELSTNKAVNFNRVPDSAWYPYTYNIYDVWGGYNVSLDHVMRHDSSIRDRKFLSLRYFKQQFTDGPIAFEQQFDPIYNSKEAVLGQLTLFKQDFIKTQYIYGFGVTEDVPYGYNMTLTSGWWKQKDLSRPYAGVTMDYYKANTDGSFCQYYARAGSFLRGGNKFEDATLMLGTSYFSKLYFSGTDFKIRQYLRGTYSRVFNPLTSEPLRINNTFGLRDFGSDSAQGWERISAQTETIFYTRYKWNGFRFAPFLYADGALLRGAHQDIAHGDFYPGIGGGVRTRNENLIFGTIELKVIYFPRPVQGNQTFNITLNSEIRYKYRTTFIHAPDIIRLNNDDWSGF